MRRPVDHEVLKVEINALPYGSWDPGVRRLAVSPRGTLSNMVDALYLGLLDIVTTPQPSPGFAPNAQRNLDILCSGIPGYDADTDSALLTWVLEGKETRVLVLSLGKKHTRLSLHQRGVAHTLLLYEPTSHPIQYHTQMAYIINTVADLAEQALQEVKNK